LIAYLTGKLDAYIADWSIKAFEWGIAIFLGLFILFYELCAYDRPENLYKEASLGAVAIMCAAYGIHGCAFSIAWLFQGNVFPDPFWLAPFVEIPLWLFSTTMVASTLYYAAFLAHICLHNRDVHYHIWYMPVGHLR